MATGREAWLGRRVLVTGHTGFKGAWLSSWLRLLGAEVHGLSLAPATSPSMFQAIGGNLDVGIGDIRDSDVLVDALRRARPEVVFHLAAQPLVRIGYAEPVETFDVNVMGTVRLLDAVRRTAPTTVRAIVVVTTDKVYAEHDGGPPYAEHARLGGPDPYSASKGCAELAVAAYRESFLAGAGVRIAAVRAGNVIGGGDWSQDRLLPDLVRAWTQGTGVVLRYPAATRPWQHVLDPLHGYLLTAEALLRERPLEVPAVNFGPPPEACITVAELAAEFAERLPGPVRVDIADSGHPREAALLTLSSALARERLGWSPLVPLDTALDWTAEWYVAHRNAADMTAVTASQLARFSAAAGRELPGVQPVGVAGGPS